MQTCLLAVWEKSPASFADFLTLFKAETLKGGLAPSNALVLIEWGCIIIQRCAKTTALWEQDGLGIIAAHSQLLELLLSLHTKAGTRKAALVVTRRALRELFRDASTASDRIEKIVLHLSSKSSSGYKNAVLLGVVAGVCARLNQPRKSTAQQNGILHTPCEALEGLKSHYYSFWVREVIGSKSIVPRHIANAFHDFFINFTIKDELEKDVVPALEKALLRAPEVVLNDLVSPTINALSQQMDLSDLVADRLLKPLVSNLKSNNGDIRSGALRALGALLKRCNDDASLDKIMDEFLKPLTTSKVPSADQRFAFAKVLDMLPRSTSRASHICSGLSGIVLKESNESAASAEISALATHMVSLMSGEPAQTSHVFPVFSKGLSDKKPSLQRVWALNVGKLVWALKDIAESPATSAFINSVLPKMLDLFNEVVGNPVAAVQAGTIVVAYVLASIEDFCKNTDCANAKSLLKKAKIVEQASTYESKPSFLLNNKVYSKISTEDDFIWLLRALTACTLRITSQNPASTSCIAWMQTFIYTAIASSVPFSVRQQSLTALSKQYQQFPTEISSVVVGGLWGWMRDLHQENKDSPAFASQADMSKLRLVLNAICLSPETWKGRDAPTNEVLENQMIKFLVLSRPELLPSVSWIELSLAAGLDPGSVVTKRAKESIDLVNSVLKTNNASDRPLQRINLAAYNTFAELAFVAPDSIVPLLVELVRNDLDLEAFRKYGPQDFAIARTPEGTTFVDVLNTKGPKDILDKGSSDYELLKWEAEVRAQQSAKRGQQKKLTTDEQAKVNAQLAKEASIRNGVQKLEQRIQRGIGTIQALALGPPTDADLWISSSLKALVDIIKAGVGLLVGESAGDAFIACSNVVTGRLGSLRQFIGVATLRSLGSSHLPEYLLQEDLGSKSLIKRATKTNNTSSGNPGSLPPTNCWRTETIRRRVSQLHASTRAGCNCRTRRWPQRRRSS